MNEEKFEPVSRIPFSLIMFLNMLFLVIAGIGYFFLPAPENFIIAALLAFLALLLSVVYDPKLGLSIIGIAYPLMFIVKGPIYKISFGLLYMDIALIMAYVVFPFKRNSIKAYGYFVPLLFVGLGSISSFVFHINSDFSMPFYRTNIYEYFMYIILFLASFSFISGQKGDRYFTTPFIFSITFLSFLLIFQYVSGIELVYDFGNTESSNRLRMYLGEGTSLNMLANLYLFVLPILFYKLLYEGHIIRRVRDYTILLVNLIPFVLFQSRSGYLGLFCGMVLSLIVFKPMKPSSKLTITLASIALLSFMLVATMPNFLIFDRLNMKTLDRDATGRITQLQAGARLILDNPLGLNKMEYTKIIEKYGGYKRSPHNLFLSVGLKIGLLGVMGYLMIIFMVLHRLVKSRKRILDKENFLLRASIFASVIAYLIHNIWHNPGYQFEVWVFLGLAIGLSSKGYVKKAKVQL